MSTEAMQVRDASPRYLAQTETQDVPPGYKPTEIGLIPIDWDVRTLGPLVTITSGESPSLFRFGLAGTPYFKVEQLNNSSKYLGSEETEYFIDGPSRTVPTGSVLFPKRGASIMLNKVRLLKADGYMDTNMMALTPGDELDCGYLFYALSHLGLASVADVTSIPQINNKHISPFAIPYPSLAEQRAIAEALSDVDGLLGALEALIAKKRAIKQAAMQQLLTGKTRLAGFSGDWEVKRLGHHVTFLRHGTYSRVDLDADEPVRYLHYGDIHTSTQVFLSPRETSMPGLPVHRAAGLDRLEDGDLVLVDASEDLDGVGRSVELVDTGGIEVVSGLHTIAARFDKAVLADGFKAYLQFCPAFRQQLTRLAAGTKVYGTNRAHIASVEMPLPQPDEQTAIATVLSDMDAEIAALEARRDKTRQIKQGMMQQLLTGRVRLVKPEAAA